MGNTICCEALRQASISNLDLVDNYIATQGAVAGDAFGSSIPKFDWSSFPLGGATGAPDLFDDHHSGGVNFLSSFPDGRAKPYFANIQDAITRGGDGFFNLHNYLDNALRGWLLNQWTKPDDYDVEALRDNPTSDDIGARWAFKAGDFVRIPRVLAGEPTYVSPEVLDPVVDRYEIFSRIEEAERFPMGAWFVPGAKNWDLQISVDNRLPNIGLGGEAEDHSGQFNRPYVRIQDYWIGIANVMMYGRLWN
jgi:hypothetical protein